MGQLHPWRTGNHLRWWSPSSGNPRRKELARGLRGAEGRRAAWLSISLRSVPTAVSMVHTRPRTQPGQVAKVEPSPYYDNQRRRPTTLADELGGYPVTIDA